MKASHGIQDRLLLFGAEWKGLSEELWQSPDLAWRYPEILKLSYQVIRASSALLELARDQSVLLAPTDPLAAAMVPYLSLHVEEERGHDKWLAEDLDVLGVSLATLDEEIPSPQIASMVGAQHYWVRHTHPVAILGYIAVLEGEPPEEGYFQKKAESIGLPETAFRTLRYHARVDREHWQDLLDLVDHLPLERRHMTLIGLSILHTCNGMAAALRQVLELPGPQAMMAVNDRFQSSR